MKQFANASLVNRKPMRRYSWFALLMAMAILLAACGSGGGQSAGGGQTGGGSGSSGSGGEAGGGAADRVVIEYWHTYSDAEERVLLDEIKPLFEEEYPHIELSITRMPYEGLKQQVIAGVAGDAAPDLMRMDIVWVPEFAQMGALKKVSDLDGFEAIRNQVFEGPLETNQYNGEYYGLPLNTNTKVAIYNKNLMEELGITSPPKTFAELEELSKQLVAAGHQPGIGISGTGAWSVLPYFWSLGGRLTNDDYTRIEGEMNSPESVQALETIVRWHEQGLVAPTILGGEPSTWDGMQNHEYFMIDDGPWFYSILEAEADDDFDVMRDTVRALMPAGDGGSRSVIGGENLVIFTNSKHPEEAWTFVQWMLSEEPQKRMGKTGMIPTNIAAATAPELLDIPFIAEYVEQLETALPRTPVPQWGEIETIFNLAVEKAVRGAEGAQQVLDEAAAQAQELLN